MKSLKYIAQLLLLLLTLTNLTFALDSARKIDSDVNGALSVFFHEVKGAQHYLDKVEGYVVFPDINKVGFILGHKYCEGALRTRGVTKSYHSMTSASIGLQMGIQTYSLVIAFKSDAALQKFLKDDKWEKDIDFNIAIADWNNDEKSKDINFDADIVIFVFDSTGIMANFTIEGTRFKRIKPTVY